MQREDIEEMYNVKIERHDINNYMKKTESEIKKQAWVMLKTAVKMRMLGLSDNQRYQYLCKLAIDSGKLEKLKYTRAIEEKDMNSNWYEKYDNINEDIKTQLDLAHEVFGTTNEDIIDNH